MPANNNRISVDNLIDIIGDLQNKADGRFAQGGGLSFSVDEENTLTAQYNGDPVNFPGESDTPEQVTTTYTMLAENWDEGVYSFESIYPSNRWNIDVSPCTDTTSEQLSAYSTAQMVGDISDNILTARGTVPSIDIVVMIDATSKKKQRVSLVTLEAENWDDNVYSLEADYPSTEYNIMCSPCTDTTTEQLEAYGAAKLIGDANSNILTAQGTVPEIDIDVMVTTFSILAPKTPRWVSYFITLLEEDWVNLSQTVSVNNVTSSSIGSVSLPTSATAEQRAAASKIHLTGQGNGTLTFIADEDPGIDVPIVVNIQL